MKNFLFALLFSTQAFALDQTQITTLHNFVIADPTASACITAGDDGCLVTYLNSASTFVVWKTSVKKDTITQTPSFDWTRVDNLTVGRARIWSEMFDNDNRAINPSNDNIRAGIDATWSTPSDSAVKAVVFSACKRNATVAEQQLATGTGTTVDPGLLTFEGSISFSDAVKIRVGQ